MSLGQIPNQMVKAVVRCKYGIAVADELSVWWIRLSVQTSSLPRGPRTHIVLAFWALLLTRRCLSRGPLGHAVLGGPAPHVEARAAAPRLGNVDAA